MPGEVGEFRLREQAVAAQEVSLGLEQEFLSFTAPIWASHAVVIAPVRIIIILVVGLLRASWGRRNA